MISYYLLCVFPIIAYFLFAALQLVKLTNTDKTGAVCLDGSPAGFYFLKASDAAGTNRFQIFLQGGGWCTSPENCLARSKTELGSSNNWPQETNQGGLMSSDCQKNYQFCSYNKVFVGYCDGNSFSGNRTQPLNVGGANIYFRGDRIIEAVIARLAQDFGLKTANTVMLSGCSAGGLASILQANHVYYLLKQYAPSVSRFGVVPLSGIFPDQANVEGSFVYSKTINSIYSLAEPTYSVPGLQHACLRAYPMNQRWRCNMAQYMLPFVIPRVFVVNSVIDSWCIPCILTAQAPATAAAGIACSGAPGWKDCGNNYVSCRPDQFKALSRFADDMVSELDYPKSSLASTAAAHHLGLPPAAGTFAQSLTALRPPSGSGAFLHTCFTHCEASGTAFFSIKINDVSIVDAVSKWWTNSTMLASNQQDEALDPRYSRGFQMPSPLGSTASANPHLYLPCEFSASNPYQCNPTCMK